MSEHLEKLRTIGAQRIHEETHIARKHAQSILDETFDDMTKIQLSGFISILEREYNLELNSLRESGEVYFGTVTPNVEEDVEVKVFVTPKKKKKYTLVYIVVVAIIFVIAVIFSMGESSSATKEVQSHQIDNSAISSAKDTIESATQQTSIDEEILEEQPVAKPEPVPVEKSFTIIPKSKLWIGYIDLATHKKYQKLTSNEISIDPNKEWILTLGHGYIDVEINGEVTEFKEKRNIRLLYKDSKLSKISFQEFKKLNKGSKW